MAFRPATLRAHRGHEFEGLAILSHERAIVATCSCGDTLGRADAVFAPCAACAGAGCGRCGGSGEVVDHGALLWRDPPDERGPR